MLVADVRNGPGRGVFRPLARHPANPHRLGIGRGVGVCGQDIGVQLDRGAVEIGDGWGGRDAGRQENRRSDQEKFLHEVCLFSDAASWAADGTVVARGEERRAGVGNFAMSGGNGEERMGGVASRPGAPEPRRAPSDRTSGCALWRHDPPAVAVVALVGMRTLRVLAMFSERT